MTKYVIGPDVAIHLAHHEAVIRGEHQILAPALLRSQLLSLLYQWISSTSPTPMPSHSWIAIAVTP